MKYDYYRCMGCERLVTAKTIQEKGKCPRCGRRKFDLAYNMGWNMPRLWELPLVWLGLR